MNINFPSMSPHILQHEAFVAFASKLPLFYKTCYDLGGKDDDIFLKEATSFQCISTRESTYYARTYCHVIPLVCKSMMHMYNECGGYRSNTLSAATCIWNNIVLLRMKMTQRHRMNMTDIFCMNNGNRRSVHFFPEYFHAFNMWKTRLCPSVIYEVWMDHLNVVDIDAFAYFKERDEFFAHPILIDDSGKKLCRLLLKLKREDIVDACPYYAQSFFEDDANVVNLDI